MAEVLDTPEVKKLMNDYMCGTATLMEKSFAQLYTCEEGKHHFHGSNLTGICCIIFDRREGKAAYLRLYDPSSLSLLFSMELYYGFKDCWQQLLPNFYCAPYFKGYVGFLFPNEKEASKITQRINNIAPKKEDLEKKLAEIKKQEEEYKKWQKKQKEKDSFLGKVKGIFSHDDDVKKPQQISGPSNFQHSSSFKFNTETGEIDVENLPQQYIDIFKKAGITKKDLQDKHNAIEIFKMIAEFNEDVRLHQLMVKFSQMPMRRKWKEVIKNHSLSNNNNNRVSLKQLQQLIIYIKQAPSNVPKPPSNAPAPPPPPPPPSAPPPPPPPKPAGGGATHNTGKPNAPKAAPAPTTADLMAQIQQGVKLKPVSKHEVEFEAKDLDNKQKDNLTDYLRKQMEERRAQLNKNKSKESDSEDDDWDDY